MRVVAFIDGFNLYHAIDDLGKNHLKWVNLRKLCEHFTPTPQFELREIYYFSACATWRPDAYKRHREYVGALSSIGVTPVMGRFKEKDRHCFNCGSRWKDHEEKETDVNLALYVMLEAMRESFDRLLLISGDSDLAPAIRTIRREFPSKSIKVIAPVGRQYSMDLLNAAGGKHHGKQMKPFHLERSLFDRMVMDASGQLVTIRPRRYDPPRTLS